MKTLSLASFVIVSWVAYAAASGAEEADLVAVQKLRAEQHFDRALRYLDQLSANTATPAEIKQVIPLERGLTLMEGARSAGSTEKQAEQLQQALSLLEAFASSHPLHPRAIDADLSRATILLDRGRSENQKSNIPDHQADKSKLQKQAQGSINQAREILQAAVQSLTEASGKYPPFIDPENEPERFAARAKIEQNLILASLNKALCTYEAARTYESNTTEFKRLLNKAADEFETMYRKYRTQVGGLYARVWQGKCYEEQRDLQKAMGIYNELLDYPGDSPVLSKLRTQTLYFKLICLNGPERHDHQLAVDLADGWIKNHADELATPLGLGIRWEQASAYESLGNKPELTLSEQVEFWTKAREIAGQIQEAPGEFSGPAAAMVQRLTRKLEAN